MNNGSQQDVPPYVAQGAPKVNFNVRTKEIMKRLLVSLVYCLTLASCAKMANVIVVTNNSGITAEVVVVTVCGESYRFTDINDTESRSARFTVKHDSGIQVDVRLVDGTSWATNFGYVTGGGGAYGNHAEIEITKDRQIVGKQK